MQNKYISELRFSSLLPGEFLYMLVAYTETDRHLAPSVFTAVPLISFGAH